MTIKNNMLKKFSLLWLIAFLAMFLGYKILFYSTNINIFEYLAEVFRSLSYIITDFNHFIKGFFPFFIILPTIIMMISFSCSKLLFMPFKLKEKNRKVFLLSIVFIILLSFYTLDVIIDAHITTIEVLPHKP